MKLATLITIGLATFSIAGCTEPTQVTDQDLASILEHDESSNQETVIVKGQTKPEPSEAPALKPESTPTPVPTPKTPESILRAFFKAMATKDLVSIEKHCVPNPDLSILAKGEELTRLQLRMMIAMAEEAPIESLKIGASFQLPFGQKIAVDETMVNDDRKLLTMTGNPVPFPIVKVGDAWLVDAGAIIAARKAAAKLREKMKAE